METCTRRKALPKIRVVGWVNFIIGIFYLFGFFAKISFSLTDIVLFVTSVVISTVTTIFYYTGWVNFFGVTGKNYKYIQPYRLSCILFYGSILMILILALVAEFT